MKAKIWAHRETTKFARRGYMYCWYYEIRHPVSDKVLASDNTGDWQAILEAANRDLAAIRRCSKLGVLKKSRGW